MPGKLSYRRHERPGPKNSGSKSENFHKLRLKLALLVKSGTIPP